MSSATRRRLASRFGPTTGDSIRLGDTNLLLSIEEDLTALGEELTTGIGGVARDGMGQSQLARRQGAVDLVISNAIILDFNSVTKADIGIRDGQIVAVGNAGNPETRRGVTIIVGNETEVFDASGLIVTSGAVLPNTAIASPSGLNGLARSGVTTVIGGAGKGFAAAIPGGWPSLRILDALDGSPLNFLLTGSGNTSRSESIRDQHLSSGLLVHDAWGATPAAIDNALSLCDELGLAFQIVPDTLNEAGFVEHTMRTLRGRTTILLDADGLEGGHVPDVVTMAGESHVLAGTAVTAIPYTTFTEDILFDLLRSRTPNSAGFHATVTQMIRRETLCATDLLHDQGALSMMTGSTVAPYANMEVVTRTWRLAHRMKEVRGALEGDTARSDNERIKRYIAKYTINPAIAYGISGMVGSVEVGKLADLVVWDPRAFGVVPLQVIKGGVPLIAGGQVISTDTSFVAFAQSAIDAGVVTSALDQLEVNLRHRTVGTSHVRDLSSDDMIRNSATPRIEVNPETHTVTSDGEILHCDPAERLPLSQGFSSINVNAGWAKDRLTGSFPLNAAEILAIVEDSVVEAARKGKGYAEILAEAKNAVPKDKFSEQALALLTDEQMEILAPTAVGDIPVTVHF